MEIVTSGNAPAAIGPYSQAIKVGGGYLFCSGQIGIDPETTEMAGDDIETQTKQVLKNIRAIVKASGSGLKDIVKTTVFLISLDDFAVVNKIYSKEFGNHKPARSTVQVSRLPLDALIEIECIAVLKR